MENSDEQKKLFVVITTVLVVLFAIAGMPINVIYLHLLLSILFLQAFF